MSEDPKSSMYVPERFAKTDPSVSMLRALCDHFCPSRRVVLPSARIEDAPGIGYQILPQSVQRVIVRSTDVTYNKRVISMSLVELV